MGTGTLRGYILMVELKKELRSGVSA